MKKKIQLVSPHPHFRWLPFSPVFLPKMKATICFYSCRKGYHFLEFSSFKFFYFQLFNKFLKNYVFVAYFFS